MQEKVFYSSCENFSKSNKGSTIEDLSRSQSVPLFKIPNEFVPKIKPRKSHCNPSPIRLKYTNIKQKRNIRIKMDKNDLKASLSFEEDYENYNFETKETEQNNLNEDTILGMRKKLINFKNLIVNNGKSKDDSLIETKSKGLVQNSSIIRSAIDINKRNLSLDLPSKYF